MALYPRYTLEAQNSRWAKLKPWVLNNRVGQLRGQVNASSMLNGGRTGYAGHGNDVEASGGAAGTRCNVGVADYLGNHQMMSCR